MRNKPLILVVDDLHVNIKILGEVLNKDKYSISFATSGRQALETAGKLKPDIILLDIVMPDLSGFDVCLQLKKNKNTSEIPIIFLSGHKTSHDDIVRGFQYGAADYLTKPFNPAELNARVCTHLDLKLRTEALRSNEKILKKTNDKLEKANEQLKLENLERTRTEKKLLQHRERLRSMTSDLIIAEELERRRVAVEIHESIGQLLAFIQIRLGSIIQSAITPEPTEKLEEILQYINRAIEEMRSVSYKLSPPILYEIGLEAAIASFIEKIEKKHGLHISLADDNKLKHLDNPSRIHLFRSVRELILNIIRHSQAQHVKISIQRVKGRIQIIIEDDGIGFESSLLDFSHDLKNGFGLFSIRERLIHLGGSFQIQSKPGKGARVFLSAPLENKKDKNGKL